MCHVWITDFTEIYCRRYAISEVSVRCHHRAYTSVESDKVAWEASYLGRL